MIKRLFLYLLHRYTNTEEGRLAVHTVLHKKVSEEYNEQTPYGNAHNAYIEFCMSQPLIRQLVAEKKYDELGTLSRGMKDAYRKSIDYLEIENRPQGRYVDGGRGFES